MTKKQEENWNLKIARNILDNSIQNPDNYELPSNMVRVCELLESYCKKDGNKKQAQAFKSKAKIFKYIEKQNKKNLGRISILAEVKEDFVIDESKEFKTFIQIVDFERYKGEKCICTYRRDGTVDVQFSGLTVNVPKKRFELWEEKQAK